MIGDPITIRMYNVGFGDCFLISFPDTPRPRRVLIDCGSIKNGTAGSVAEVAKRIVADVTDDDGPHIDVVVMSHFHQDHISGFADRATWRDVEVGEVWLPWTEQPDDPLALELRHRQLKLAEAVQHMADEQARLGMADDEVEFLAAAADNVFAAVNVDAMDTLLEGFAGDPERRFLYRRTEPRKPTVLPTGLKVHVLGPSKNPDVISRMDPPSKESFLRVSPDGGGAVSSELPFRAWELPQADVERLYAGMDVTDIKARLEELGRNGSLLAASILSSAVNNTSLVLVFEYGDAFLLFPGDAQWGTWELILGNDRNSRLMERISFYKIGHHGSHNASPKTLVERCLPEGVWSAASVRKRGNWDIPRTPLLDALRKLTPKGVVRSDRPPTSPPDNVTVQDNRHIEIEISTAL